MNTQLGWFLLLFTLAQIFGRGADVVVTSDFTQRKQVIAGFGGASSTALRYGRNLTVGCPRGFERSSCSYFHRGYAVGYLVPGALTLTSLKPLELRLKLAGGVGQSYAVETSPDLLAWTTALKVTLTSAIVEVALPDNNESARFIRTRNN